MHRGVSQGGSTITQQLAKNLFLTQERTVTRKLQEVLLALWLERKFSKTQILELYLNRVYFGAGAYGIEQASQRYFGKSARQITLAEAALLAGLVKSPSRLAPTRNYDGAEQRARVVLAAMAELGFISPASQKLALAKPPRIAEQSATGSVNYVADWVMDGVNDILGHVDEDLVVHTTIDSTLQATAEKAVSEELAQKGDKAGVSQGALVAMAPEDGAVRAMVGGRNYAESQFNRAVAAKRQPGSAFKAFVYLTALEHGLTPDTVRLDAPIKIKGWSPENYGHEYYGPVTLAKALALSLNTVSVRLTMELTPAAVVLTAHRLGIASQARAQRLDRARHVGSVDARTDRRLRALRQWRHGGDAARHREDQRRQRQTALQPQRRGHRPHHRAARRGRDERDDGGDADHRHRQKGVAARLAGGGQDRHLARISATPGSSATPRTSSPASGSATTTARRRGTLPAAACRSRSGAASCARRIRACRSKTCPEATAAAASSRDCSAAAMRHRRRHRPTRCRRRGCEPTASAPRQTTGSGGLDTWFINNLFGRR